MSDFAFMNSGMGDADYGDYIHEMNVSITALLSIFITNSLEDSMKYVKICKRSAVTKHDLEMALKFQASKFFSDPNFDALFQERRQQILDDFEAGSDSDEEDAEEDAIDAAAIENNVTDDAGSGAEQDAESGAEEDAESDAEEDEDNAGEESEGEWEDVPEYTSFMEPEMEDGLLRILDEYTVDDDESEEFARANMREVDIDDRVFIRDIHKCVDSWNTWVPQNDMEKCIFNAIETMTSRF